MTTILFPPTSKQIFPHIAETISNIELDRFVKKNQNGKFYISVKRVGNSEYSILDKDNKILSSKSNFKLFDLADFFSLTVISHLEVISEHSTIDLELVPLPH